MKISFKGDYALKIILELALNYDRDLIRIGEISKNQDIPKKYLEQIILILKGAGYIRTQRGPAGGISLSKPPAKITMGEIIRLMEGPTSPITCVSTTGYTKCSFEKDCVFRGIWMDIKNKINAVVDHITFADLVKKAEKFSRHQSLNYNI